MAVKSSSVNKAIKNGKKGKTKARLSPALKSLLERADRARHEFKYREAVDLYTQAIDSGKLDLAHEFDARYGRRQMLIDNFESQKVDVKQMAKLAQALKDPVRQTRALIEEVKVIERKDTDAALPKAQAAVRK